MSASLVASADDGLGIEFLNNLKTSLKKRYKKRRTGIHVSDLSNCHRQVVFRDLIELELSNRELNFFTSGSAIGAAVEALADVEIAALVKDDRMLQSAPTLEGLIKYIESKEAGKRYSTEEFCNLGGFINGHIDVYDKILNMPIELKSSRSSKMDKLPKSMHVDQLKSYMAAKGADIGLLVYQLLMKFEGDPWVVFPIKMTQYDREAWTMKKIEAGMQLLKARAYKSPGLAPHVQNDKELNWLCRECPFKKPCDELNKIQAGEMQ